MEDAEKVDPKLARTLILEELFDLELYKRLLGISDGNLRQMLEELIPIEAKHAAFWQDFFGKKIERLDVGRRLKLALIVGICRLFGTTAIHLTLEATEIYGLRKYLSVWKIYKGFPLEKAVREILTDEFQHEDRIVSEQVERKINPEKIRNIFLGFNDGLVEILGAVSGFFAAFGETASVLIASSTVAVAGSLSMAAGVYASSSSEKEVLTMERGKARFLGAASNADQDEGRPLGLAFIVGISYFIGAIVPIVPVLFGARSIAVSLIMAGGMIILVSLVLAFLSGMEIKRRILTNLVIIALAVGVTYAIGVLAKNIWGIAV